MNGFVNIQRTEFIQISSDSIKQYLDTLDQESDSEKNSVLKTLSGNLYLLTITCARPNYSAGSGAKLAFGKKAATQNGALSDQKQVEQKATIWTVSALDDDMELEDEDNLLDDQDLILPSTKLDPADCSTRKKACKDCSCGRAEEEESTLIAKITLVEKKRTVASSCGSCYLGDAFRCSSCPFLGMPAFKPGEKVQLGGNLLKNDLT